MTAPKRIRRTPEEARRVILDAAEECMAVAGPAGIRLQDVARAAGVSHPSILHHFGSREGLIWALNRRTIEELRTMVVGVISTSNTSQNAVTPTFAAYRGGLAQRMLWLLQSGTPPAGAGLPMFDEIVDTLHATRERVARPGVQIEKSDTLAIVHLTVIAAFGDAIIGPRLRRNAGEAEEVGLRTQFETWFADLLNHYIAAKGRGDQGDSEAR